MQYSNSITLEPAKAGNINRKRFATCRYYDYNKLKTRGY